MKSGIKFLIASLVTIVAIVIVVVMKPLPQDLAYHFFADDRTIAGVSNFANVVSNIPFLLVGIWGFNLLRKSNTTTSINLVYSIVFIGIMLTGLGSAYYHYLPNNDSLVFDRMPMTLVFMAFLSSTIVEWINVKLGTYLLFPLLLLGVASVLWWRHTELIGAGDLRFYGFIQFYPMIMIPLIFLLYYTPVNGKGLNLLVWVIVWYVIAKLFEMFDKSIYAAMGFISGHSLKHVAAAIATWYIVRFYGKRHAPAVSGDLQVPK